MIPTTSASVNIRDLHPRFRDRLAAFFQHPEIVGKVKVVSGARTIAQQRALYAKYKAGKGNLAANPDRVRGGWRGSAHMCQQGFDGYAYAVDFRITGRGLSTARLNEIAATFGVVKTVPSEWWHHSPIQLRNNKLVWFPYTAGKEKPYKAVVKSELEQIAEFVTALQASILRRGDRGLFVDALQRQLERHGFPVGKPDGVFGRKTDRAVRAFQQDAGLAVDGIVGPASWVELLA
jgi:hypothetical protein